MLVAFNAYFHKKSGTDFHIIVIICALFVLSVFFIALMVFVPARFWGCCDGLWDYLNSALILLQMSMLRCWPINLLACGP